MCVCCMSLCSVHVFVYMMSILCVQVCIACDVCLKVCYGMGMHNYVSSVLRELSKKLGLS